MAVTEFMNPAQLRVYAETLEQLAKNRFLHGFALGMFAGMAVVSLIVAASVVLS